MKKSIVNIILASTIIVGGSSTLAVLTTSCGETNKIHLSNFPTTFQNGERHDITATCGSKQVTITAAGIGSNTHWTWDGKTLWYCLASTETILVTFTFTAENAKTLSVVIALEGNDQVTELIDASEVFTVTGTGANITGQVSYQADIGKVIKLNTDDVTFIGSDLEVSFKNNGKINGMNIVGLDDYFLCVSVGNDNITSITFPDTIASIGRGFLAECKITSLDLSNTSISSIPDEAFESTRTITEITFPSTITNIGEKDTPYFQAKGVFYGCYSLTTLHLKSTSVPTLGTGVFETTKYSETGNVGQHIYVPSTLVSAYTENTDWQNLYSGSVITYISSEPAL